MAKKKSKKFVSKRVRKKKDKSILPRTFSTYIDNSSINHKIFNYLAHQSKNVFNYATFIITVFEKYNNRIFKSVHKLLKQDYFIDTEAMEEYIYQSMRSAMDQYSKVKPLINTNNNIIYKYIQKKLAKTHILNNNFFKLENEIIEEIREKNLIEFTEENIKDVFTEIVRTILKSFYCKNFFHVKNSLLHKTKIKITDKKFIDQVKNNKFLFKENGYVNYRSEIIKYLKQNPDSNIVWKTNQNYVTRFIYQSMCDFHLPSDLIGNIIKKTYESYCSFRSLRANGKKANRPRFLPKDGTFVLPFFERSFKEEKINDQSTIRLTVGKFIAENFNTIIGSDEFICLNKEATTEYKLYIHYSHLKYDDGTIRITKGDNHIVGCTYVEKSSPYIINAYYVYIPKPKKIIEDKINLIEINPIYTDHKFKINIVFNKKVKIIKPNDEVISIDTGMINLLTIYNPNGKCRIIKGGYINHINSFYNKLISKCKSILAIEANNRKINELNNNDPIKNKFMKHAFMAKINTDYKDYNKQTSKKIRDLYIRRANKINDYFNNLVKWFMSIYENIDTVVIGYNNNWKNGINLGTRTNRKFCQIPYRQLINKLRDALEAEGKNLIEKNESYTSKCDALLLESIEYHKKYSGKRTHRGLFKSGTGQLLNADINGAINILRKWYESENDLRAMDEIKEKYIFNPLVVHQNCIN
jgi:IS605 OrfB family transposase